MSTVQQKEATKEVAEVTLKDVEQAIARVIIRMCNDDTREYSTLPNLINAYEGPLQWTK